MVASMTIESALVILIPEAENFIETFRKRYDPAAAGNFPAHVTILYPFKSPDELTPGITKTLHRLFLTQPGFTASFPEVQCFPDMLYLAPVPAEPFRQLTEMIVKHFPETPPYGGAFAEIVPHLTIAQASNGRPLDEIAADFIKTARKAIPIQARVNTVTLMVNSGDGWGVREHFPLGKARGGG
jgi:2'-5' RNA ligase